MRRRLLKSEQGSIMILGLGFLGMLVVPLIAILYFASQGSTAVSVARGTAYSSAYSGLSRSIDFDATLNSENRCEQLSAKLAATPKGH